MDHPTPPAPAADERGPSARAFFAQQWRVYRALVDGNYLYHREAYACLHDYLVANVSRLFRFLDIACGDASASVAALRGTSIASYVGIDQSGPALDLARGALVSLGRPFELEQRDFVEALRDPSLAADIAWIGLSLHHLQTPDKLAVMRDVRRIVGDAGSFLIYEDASPDGEDRAGWLRRWDLQEPRWTGYAPEDWTALCEHVHAADYPETVSGWLRLAREAGFGSARELFVAPSNLLRLFCFSA